MLISILIVNYNGLKHLEDCLGSIRSQAFQDFEIVMVDNDSRDGSIEFVTTRFPEVRLVRSDVNLGFAGGNNLGLRHCRGDFVFLLNNDTRLDPAALTSLAGEIRAHPTTRVFACFLVDFHRPDRADSAGDTLYTAGVPFSFAGFPVSMFKETRPVTSACAGAAVYARSLLDALRGFDEAFFLIFEDVDLSLRARHMGEEILFLPSVKVYHKGSASLGGKRSPLSFYYSERNFLPLLIKNYPLAPLLRTLPRYFLIKALRIVHALRLGCLGAYLRANRDTLKMLPAAFRGRREILGSSRITSGQFDRLLRRNWLSEKLSISKKNYFLPL